MGSLVARTAHLSRSWSSAVAGIWSSLRGSLSSSVWPHRSYSDEGLDGRVAPSPEASSAADPPVDFPLSRALPKTQTIGTDRPVYDRNAYPLTKSEGFGVYRPPRRVPSAILEPHLSRRALNVEVGPVGECMRVSRNVAQKCCHESPRQGFACGTELPVGSTCGRGNMDLPIVSTTSEEIAILKHRQEQGLYEDSSVFVEILKRCSKQKDIVAVRQLHHFIIQSGMDRNPYVMNTLLNAYIRCRRLQDARRVFYGFEKKTVVTWRIMIAGYAENHNAEDAMLTLNRMRQGGIQPNETTCLSVLKACASPVSLKWGRELHACIRDAGLEANVRVGTALVQMYAKCGCLTEARRVFENLTNRDVITWNVMIGAYAESGIGSEACGLFLQMIRERFIPDAITYMSILNASASAGASEWVKEVHGHARRTGLESDVRVGNAFVHMYGKSGCIDDARLVFDRMEKRDVITWNIMIGAYAESGCGGEAYQLFLQMKREGFIPNAITYMSILNASASAGALEWVKEVHGHARRAGLETDLRVGNALVHMYGKSGNIDEARQVFDRMKKRDVTTWTVMIGAYAESGCGVEAYQVFLEMKREGFIPDAITYLSMLNASSAGALERVKEVHDHARRAGLDSDFRVANALAHMYARSGSIGDARRVFDRMEKRGIITWNIMIGGYAENGCGVEAYRLFLQMKREGFIPDAITYMNILNVSASAGALEWVKEVHRHAERAGLHSDLRVGNALVYMYAKSGSIGDSRLVFDRMEKRDVITWNGLIGAYAESGRANEAYRLFLQMERDGIIPDAITYVSILNASVSAGAVEWVKAVEGHARRAGLAADLRVGNALVHMYGKSGSIVDARLVFDGMEKRDVITWTTMIGAYAESGSGVEAYRLYLQMKREGLKPNPVTFVSLLNASASAGALEWVKEVHGDVRRAGLETDLRVGGALVHMYAKIGSMDDARLVFDRMKKRNVITWNIMIGAYAGSGCGAEAYRLFLQMKREGFIPDATTYVSALNGSASAGVLEWVKEVHGHAHRDGLDLDLRVGNALVHAYAKIGSIDEARVVFDGMENRDLITWNIMIGAYAESGCGVDAYRLFLQMGREGFKPDAVTYMSILNASASAGALDWVKKVHSHALESGLESDLRVGNALVHMYAKSGSIEDARLIFDRMKERDVVTFKIMIGGLAQHGRAHEALILLQEMNADCVKPDGTLFVAVLSACSHAGLVDDGRKLFLAMMQDYGIEPTVMHYNCMVDLLGRAGHLEEAKLLIGQMPVEPDVVTWTALLGACRTYGNVELGEVVAQEVLKLEPKDASAYVLLSNIYAAAGMWEKVSSVRSMMQERGVRKEPGRSWIEVDNKIHEFVVGDTSHPEAKAIYTELNKLTEKLKAEGYIPDTQLVLQDIGEEDKELALSAHSERLAIAYGLMRTPHGKPIRVYKNLRVCSDCHTATKFTSKVTRREIIARDANRFHHFKDGVCSCGDYW